MSKKLTAIANDLDSFVHDMREDGNDASALWLEQRASALRRLAAAGEQKPIGYISPATERMLTNDANGAGAVIAAAGYDTTTAVYLAPQPAPGWDNVNVSRDVLLTLISALDCALGDTDPSIDPDYTDEEVKRDYPVFWVCQQLSALRTLVRSKPTDTVATVVVKPFGHHFWKSNGDGTESPDFCEGEIPSWKKGVRNVTPLYTNQPLAVEDDLAIRSADLPEPAPWPDPTPEMLDNDALFDAIWETIKSWDVNVPTVYSGYCGATGNHARAIYDAVKPLAADSNASAEARLRKALEEIKSIENNEYSNDWYEIDKARYIATKALRPHASDCEKQGETTKSEGGDPSNETAGGFPVAAAPYQAEETGVIQPTRQGAGVERGMDQCVTVGRDRQPSDRPADVTDLKTDPKLLDLLEKAKNYVMTPEEIYEQRRSFVRGMCPSNRDFKEWCVEVDKLLPPDAFTVGRR